MSGKVGFASLGCPKALADSERIPTQLRTEGYQVAGRYDEAIGEATDDHDLWTRPAP